MTISSDAARRAAAAAAAEAARRAAEAERRRKAAEEAKKKAAAEAAKKAAAEAAKRKQVTQQQAQALSKAAGQKPMASAVRQSFGKDELSTGLGRALHQRSASALGGAPLPSAPTAPARTTSLSELRALQAKGVNPAAAPPLAQTPARLMSPDAADRAARAKGSTPAVSADAAERAARSQGATSPVRYASADAAERAAQTQGAAPAEPTPAERAAADAEQIARAYDDRISSGGSEAEAANAAAQELRTLTQESDDIAYNNALIRAAQPTLDKVTDALAKNAKDDGLTGDDDKRQIKDAVRALSDAAAASGEIGTFMIADQLAQKMPDDDELMHLDDGFYEHVDNGGDPNLMAALASRLDAHGKDDAREGLVERGGGGLLGALDDAWDATGGKLVSAAGDVVGAVGDGLGAVVGFAGDAAGNVLNVIGKAGEMAVDVAQGTVELAGNAAEWTTEQVMDAAEYAARNGLRLAGEALNFVGDHARELAAEALNIDGQLEQLNSPGDTVTLAVGGTIGATVLQGGAEVEMKITKTENGYEMTLSGEVSGGVFGGLNIPGFAEAQGEANATGVASATMTFPDLASVTQAAETVGGIGIATAVGGPAGALLTGATASDEIREITDHFTSGSIGLELSAEATAELGSTAGLGFGGSVSGVVTNGVRVEITPGQPPALVLEQSLEASGSLALGAPVEIPSLGGTLNGGSIDGSATVSAETRVPLPPGISVGDLASDPVGTMREVGSHAIDNATTKLSLGVDISGGAALEGLPGTISADGGLEIELSGEAKTKDLVGALTTALSGDLGGALRQLGEKSELSVDVSTYSTSGFDIEEEITVPGFTIGIHAQNERRDETEVWSFEGSPAELAQEGFNLFGALQMNVS